MFYPEDSLKRGGRFYLCWVADSWPLRFATITHRQLWSQDIRRICEDLLEVITNESGRPTQRFSLRLSSQLLRGLVRLYQRKVNVLLGDLCMINSYVIKTANKKEAGSSKGMWQLLHESLKLIPLLAMPLIIPPDHHWSPTSPLGDLYLHLLVPCKCNNKSEDTIFANSYNLITLARLNVQEVRVRPVRRPLQQLNVQAINQEPEETEQRIEELIQASGNAVANIQDITLREPIAVSENMLLRPNDGFGEENLDQPLQLLQDRTIEMMLNPDVMAAHVHSGLEMALDITDKSHDKSRLNVKEAQMERISEHDLTMFRKSAAEELMPPFEKDIPEIPEIPPLDLPVPLPEKPREQAVVEEVPQVAAAEPPRAPEMMEIELEELEDEPQPRRRKLRNKLMIDKKTKISTQQFRARIENPLVELRCEDSSDDIIFIRVPPEVYFARPCHSGPKVRNNIGFEISRLFSRNLGVLRGQPRAERELEEVMQRANVTMTRSLLERIEEEQEVPIVAVAPLLAPPRASDVPGEGAGAACWELDLEPTQKVETLSQARKRAADEDAAAVPSKLPRPCGFQSFRESQKSKQILSEEADLVADKENRPENMQQLQYTVIEDSLPPISKNIELCVVEQVTENEEPITVQNREKIISSMLQEAGLADIQNVPSIIVQADVHAPRGKAARGARSDSSETPLGSLDRTKVSLGDSEQTTDSKRFIRDQWGTEGTMLKILKFVQTGRQPVNVTSLVSKGPVLLGHERVIAARCFTSILKLKAHGFVYISKDPETLEIIDINLGPKLLTSSQEF